MCPTWDLSALHTPPAWLWTNTDLAAQEPKLFQGLLYPKTSDENAAAPRLLEGKGVQVKLCCLTENMLVADLA